MNEHSRTKNSIKNLILNFGYQAITIGISFFIRRVFIESLGVDYLGIGSLFSNILGILSLAELGIGGAISYSMYKELADNNIAKLKALNTYYKTLYNRIALIILIVGLSLLPFLKYIINLENEIPNVEIFYLIYVLNSVLSYCFIYKTTIVTADQKDYKLKIVSIIFDLCKLFAQLFVLFILKNYYLYLMIMLFSTLIGNFVKSRFAEKWYPYIKETAELNKSEKKEIWNNIKSMFYYRIGGVLISNTDNILISVLVNTTMVGYFSNYQLFLTKLDSIIGLIFNSVAASVGNLGVVAKKEEKYKIFNVLNFVTFIMISLFSLIFFFAGDDLVRMISGSNAYVLGKDVLIVAILNFYTSALIFPIASLRTANGLFVYTKYSKLISASLNIVFSILLGIPFGLFGIIVASSIARLMVTSWYEPYILYTKCFCVKTSCYFKEQFTRFLITIIVGIILIPIISSLNINNLYARILVECCIVSTLFFMIIFIIYRKNSNFEYIKNLICRIINNVKKSN